ncbi:hypothetical protein QBC43DRAFT_197450 [Cladorrhinum sp. PSN259]|nr:hypothetical protein QBC43DRAFT_197450 [Cladorrhinum sp. PSN259]
MAYNYGPPPPAPPPAPPSGSSGGYTPYGTSRGGHSGRGGRGGPDRGGFHQPPPSYGYGQQPQYGPQAPPTPYPAGPHTAQPPYPQPPHSQPPQQQWHPDHGQQHPPQPNQHATPLTPQNYHPNYAPQMYQQPSPYSGQPQYPHAAPPAYGQGYQPPAPPGPPAQPWANHPQSSPTPGPYGGGGRGGRGGYNDRGAPKMMGPPLRIGFDGNTPPNPPAPVSAPYPPQPYGGPHGPPAPYPGPYQGYPPAPYMPVPPPFDGHSGHNTRHHNRGGFHNNNKSRPHFAGDKNRNRNHNKGPNAQTPPTHHQKPDAASASKKKKRKTNTLGLTPGDDSDEDDENEEERLSEMIGSEAPNPKTSADIANWIAERRANFPTKAKIEAKKAQVKADNGGDNEPRPSKLEQRAEKLRKQLEKVESSIKRKREQQDEGDDMRELNLSSSPSSDSKSDDEKPEVMSTRQDSNNLPPPPKKADPTKHCKYYSTGGTCGKRGKCRFVHDAAVREAALKEREMNGGRMTLQQRLTLNDKEQEDLTIVQTLKYLQDKGVVPKKAANGTEGKAESSEAQEPASQTQLPTLPKKESNSGHGLPPIPPPSLVSNGPNSKYSGWNLSGFGNTGVRTSDQ